MCYVFGGDVGVWCLMCCPCVFLIWYMCIYRYMCLCFGCLPVFCSMCCFRVCERFPGVCVFVLIHICMRVGVLLSACLLLLLLLLFGVLPVVVCFFGGCVCCVVLVVSLLRVCAFVVFHICVGLCDFFFVLFICVFCGSCVFSNVLLFGVCVMFMFAFIVCVFVCLLC